MAIKALEQELCEDAITRILKRMWNCRGKHTTSIDKVKMEQIIRDELSSSNPQEPNNYGDCYTCLNKYTNKCNNCMVTEYQGKRVSFPTNYKEQAPMYCDRNICIQNEYNGIGCDECEVTKSQEQKTGHWIKLEYWLDRYKVQCSECAEIFDMGIETISKHCPNCGVKIVESQESEDKE